MISRPPKIYAPALYVAVAVALGIAMTRWFPADALYVWISLAGAVLLALLSFGTTGRWRTFAVLSAFFLLGAARMEMHRVPPKNFWGNFRYIRAVRVVVRDFPRRRNGRWDAVAEIVAADTGAGFVKSCGKVKLHFYSPEKPLSYGQLWEIKSTPAPLDDEDTPYIRYLRLRGISGELWAREDEGFLLDEDRGNPFLRGVVVPIRKKITAAAKSSLSSQPAALLEGMLLGGGRDLSPETREFFKNAGTIHILAVSGLHIGIVSLALGYLLRRKFKFSPAASFLITAAALGLYCLLAQLRPSVVRASLMMAFLLGAPIVRRKANPINSLGAAALTILLFRPADLFSPGFQLSFAAAGGIIYLLPRFGALLGENFLLRTDPLARMVQLLLVTVSAQMGTTAISVFHFSRFQLVAPISNLFVVPAVAPAVIIGFVGTALWALWAPLGKLVLLTDGLVLNYILAMTKFFGSLPFSFVAVAAPPLWALSGYYSFILGIANFLWSFACRIFVLAGALSMALFGATYSPPTGIFYIPSGVVLFAGQEVSAVYADCAPSRVHSQVLPDMYSLGLRAADILFLPYGRPTARSPAQIIRGLSLGTVLCGEGFPDSLCGGSAEISGEISGRFISPKNCIVEYRGKRVLILRAPPDSLDEKFDLVVVDFPRNMPAPYIFVPSADIYVFGSDARGWEKSDFPGAVFITSRGMTKIYPR